MKKRLKITVIVIVIVTVFLVATWRLDFSRGEPEWGITFSQKYAEEDFELPRWREAYLAVLDDLGARKLRLVVYWSRIEHEQGKFDFGDIDWQLKEAEARGKEVILVTGFRVPRWPECFIPSWIDPSHKEGFEEAVLNYLRVVVERYASSPAVNAWQVENEPLLTLFGECPGPDRELLKKEIAFVKSLDPSRPVLITDSGELSLWTQSAGLSEWFGTTVYRNVWNPYVGHFWYFYPPAFYALKAYLVKTFTDTARVIVAELQAEPWAPDMKLLRDVPFDEQAQIFSVAQLKKNLEFTRKTGLPEAYLWGAEWWYWRKLQGDNSYWQAAREVIR